jgi:hypothetical protein
VNEKALAHWGAVAPKINIQTNTNLKIYEDGRTVK